MKPETVKTLQKILGVPSTGIIDDLTVSAIKNFRLRIGKSSININSSSDVTTEMCNEIVDRLTPTDDAVRKQFYESIEPLNSEDSKLDDAPLETSLGITTDLSEQAINMQLREIKQHMLPKHEYVSDRGKSTNIKSIFLHHTAGWNNPYSVVDDWARDKRGRIGTKYVIGGIDIRTGDTKHDGVIVQCIPDGYFAFHLGLTNSGATGAHDLKMARESIGIELCNFGWLTERNGKFYTYTDREIPKKYVTDLGYNFRGYRYWHSYTKNQIESLRYLLHLESDQNKIDLKKGLRELINLNISKPQDAFQYNQNAVDGKLTGVLSHTNVVKGKFDVFPQPELIEMILSL